MRKLATPTFTLIEERGDERRTTLRITFEDGVQFSVTLNEHEMKDWPQHERAGALYRRAAEQMRDGTVRGTQRWAVCYNALWYFLECRLPPLVTRAVT